jgi:hypothetical protein
MVPEFCPNTKVGIKKMSSMIVFMVIGPDVFRLGIFLIPIVIGIAENRFYP